MTTSRIPAVIDALVATLTTALPNVKVIDGPFVNVPDGDYLTVGRTPDGEHPTGELEFVGVATSAQNERIDIPCYIDSYSGSTDVATRRNAAMAVLGVVQTSVRSDMTLGGAILQPGWAWVGSYNMRTEQTGQGLAVGVVFHINAQTRI